MDREAEQESQESRMGSGLYHEMTVRLVKILNVVLVSIPFVACWLMYYASHVVLMPSTLRSVVIIVMFVLFYCFFGRVYDSFHLSIDRISEMFISQLLSILIADGFMFITLWLMSGSFPYMLPALAALAGQLLLSLLWCKYAHTWYFRNFSDRKTAVIYGTAGDWTELNTKLAESRKFHVVKYIAASDCTDMRELDGMAAVFLVNVPVNARNAMLKHCIANKIRMYIVPCISDVIMSGSERVHMFHLPMLSVKSFNPSPEYVLTKRAFDIFISSLLIVLTSPLMLGVAIAIKAQDGGPVLYKQTRLTRDGKTFRILKFRSMRTDAEKDGVARLSSGSNDSRITPVGRFIRSCRIDELPQLFNVFVGSMSIVGPRPERPEIAAQYEQTMPEFRLRLQAKAGITGYAQVYGKYNTEPHDKLKMDLMYIAHASVIEDIKIIFATIRILFDKESTEGIETSTTTAMRKHANSMEENEP